MSTVKRWDVDIVVSQQNSETRAEARLHADDKVRLVGTGSAWLNPKDENIPEIGHELAVARALSDLAHRLVHVAAEDIETVTRQPANLQV